MIVQSEKLTSITLR